VVSATAKDGDVREIVPDREGSAEEMRTKSAAESNNSVHGGERLRALMPYVCMAAILLAPLLAALVRVEAGLVVMGIALSATAILLHTSMGELPARHRRLLGMLFVVNCALALACFAVAFIRLRIG
jgi:hypothetical protein